MSNTTVNIGNIDLKGRPVQECGDCHSRNIVTKTNELDKDYVNEFVRARMSRLNLNVDSYDIKINKSNGAVTATLKPNQQLEFDFS